MATRAEIHTFAKRWARIFESDLITQSIGYEQTLPHDAEAVGFVMDSFAALTANGVKLPVIDDWPATVAFIRAVSDLQALGNGIYSMWRQVTYWNQESLALPENRRWFTLAFKRLVALSVPLGKLTAVTLTSTRNHPEHYPEGELVAQTLMLANSGAVTLENVFGSGYTHQQTEYVEPEVLKPWIQRLATLEDDPENVLLPTECDLCLPPDEFGNWELTIQGTDGQQTVSGIWFDHEQLSDQLREVLPFPHLLLLDGAPDRLERLIAEYHGRGGLVEKFVIDRHSETFSFTARDGKSRTHLAIANDAVATLLDDIFSHCEFDGAPGHPTTNNFTITQRFRYAQTRSESGTLNLDDPIDNWDSAADLIMAWLKDFLPQMIDTRILTRTTPYPGDLLYAKVVFHHGERPYSYLADPKFAVGDRVVVPTTYATQYGTIVDMAYYAPDKVPYPPEKTKQILRLADPVAESEYPGYRY